MTDHNTSGVSRRSIAKGAAWAAPVIAVAATAPVAAASRVEPPKPEEFLGNSCKVSGKSGGDDNVKAFYGQIKVVNPTESDLVYTITSFKPSGEDALTNIKVFEAPGSLATWNSAGSTFTVPAGETMIFWLSGNGETSANGLYTMTYSVIGYGDGFTAYLNYTSMPVCCNQTPLCPPGAPKFEEPEPAKIQSTQSDQASNSAESQAPVTQTSPSSAQTTSEQAAPTSEAAAPVTETQTAKATESAVATVAPASSSN